jgi:RNA recognition motif 2
MLGMVRLSFPSPSGFTHDTDKIYMGAAFVNFIDVEDLLLFAKTKLGVKWNMYSSDKVLQMSYANVQGKEALVEKFKNSCVMEMQVCCGPIPIPIPIPIPFPPLSSSPHANLTLP